MNPMIRKELRQRMRERRGWLLPSLYLLALGAAVALGYYFQIGDPFGFGRIREPQGAEIGVTVFLVVVFTQMALLLLLAPVFSAGSVTIEKEQRTLGGLLTSLLSPWQIWWGKFVAAMLFVVLLQLSALPVLSLAFSLGGVGPLELAKATGITLVVLASLSSIGLYCSTFFRRSVHSTAVSYAIVIALTVLTYVATMILFMQLGPSERYTTRPPWYVEVPMQLNPFFPLDGIFETDPELFPSWILSLFYFAGFGCLATALALRNLERGGEQL